MADQAPEIKVKLTAEDTGVAAAIKSLGDRLSELKTQSKDTSASFVNLKSAFDSLIASAVVYKIVEFGKEVFTASVNVERMSQKTGVSAGFLSTFGKAAESSGVSSEQMSTSLGKLATNITKFQEGSSKATAAFKALNLTQADFKGLSSDEKVRLVTDRLGAMENGLQKAAIAQQLMGRGGQALIPTLNALAGDDVADALTNQIEDGGVSSFKALGEEAGTVVKTLVLAWQIGANTIGAILLTLYDVVAGQFKQLGNAVETLGEAGIDASRGHFADAGKAIAAGFHNGVAIAKTEVDDLQSRWTALASVVATSSVALFPDDATAAARQKAREARFKNKGDGSDDDPQRNDDKANKARLSLIEAQLQEEGVLFKAKNAQAESANQIAYEEGLESLRQYFGKRKALAQAESDEQISILRRQRAAVAASPTDGTEAGEIAKKQKLAKLDNEIAVAKVTATTKQGQIDQQLFAAEESHQKTLLGYQAQILALQGLTYESAIAKIQGEESELRRSLAQSGLTPAGIDEMVAKLQGLKTATAKFDEDRKDGDDALKKLANDRAAIELQVTAGLETQYGAQQKIAQLELQRVPELQKIAAAMHAAAINPDQIQAADDFSQKINQIQVSAKAAQVSMQQFGKTAGTAIQGDLNTFLTSTIISARNVGDAFRQLAGSVVGSIQKIVTQLLIQIVTQKLLQAITKQHDQQGGGSGGMQTAAAAKTIAAGAVMAVGGTLVKQGADALQKSSAALLAAATMLLIANAAGGGGGVKAAGGGLIRGPGTGTSDSIPARLSDGEFVVQASAVRAVGVDALATINRGFRIPSINGLSIPRFAEGGLVQDNRGGHDADIRLGIGLDEGLVLKHLGSKAAGKVMIQHLANNPKAAGKALQRGE